MVDDATFRIDLEILFSWHGLMPDRKEIFPDLVRATIRNLPEDLRNRTLEPHEPMLIPESVSGIYWVLKQPDTRRYDGPEAVEDDIKEHAAFLQDFWRALDRPQTSGFLKFRPRLKVRLRKGRSYPEWLFGTLINDSIIALKVAELPADMPHGLAQTLSELSSPRLMDDMLGR